MLPSDRREFQRLRLAKPVLGLLDGMPALVLDLGVTGAFVEHHGTVQPGAEALLSFRWKAKSIEFLCRVAHSAVVRQPASDGISDVSHSGLQFLEPQGDSAGNLQDMIATYVGQILAAQRSNAAGKADIDGFDVLSRLGEARRRRTSGFLTFRLRGRTWWKIPSRSRDQPADGFTVAAWEDPDEIALLCQTYAQSDEEGRRLIRLIAELSAATVR